jgi:hypothetical protein
MTMSYRDATESTELMEDHDSTREDGGIENAYSTLRESLADMSMPAGKTEPRLKPSHKFHLTNTKISTFACRSLCLRILVALAALVVIAFLSHYIFPKRRGQMEHEFTLGTADLATATELPDQVVTSNQANTGLDPSSIHVLVPCDEGFQQRYHLVTESIKCYAEKFGYTYHFLDRMKEERSWLNFHWVGNSKQACSTNNFFFDKHCLVARYLQANPQVSHAVVFDADVMAVPDQPLDHWINTMNGADLLFYERCTQIEVMAGNYIARNTDAARDFLEGWSQWGPRQPSGFCSADNGAIHIHLLHKLGLEVDEPNAECLSKWNALTKKVDDLDDYFTFVQCCRTKLKMGMHPSGPGHPHSNDEFNHFRSLSETGLQWGKDNLKVVILPQNTAFAHDHVCGGPGSYKTVAKSHPTFHHGVKREEFVGNWWEVAVDSGIGSVLKQTILTEKVIFKIE